MDSKAVKDESQNTSVEEIEAKHDTIEATGQNKIVELRKIPLTFKEQSGRKTSFEMKWKALLGKAFKWLEGRNGVVPGTYKFYNDGQRLSADQTPQSANLIENDEIDVMVDQIGGQYYSQEVSGRDRDVIFWICGLS